VFLARVVGTVVATHKDPRLEGLKLLLVTPVTPQGELQTGYQVAVDTVDSGFRETVICVRGSSARLATGIGDRPVDTAIVGIVDRADVDDG